MCSSKLWLPGADLWTVWHLALCWHQCGRCRHFKFWFVSNEASWHTVWASNVNKTCCICVCLSCSSWCHVVCYACAGAAQCTLHCEALTRRKTPPPPLLLFSSGLFLLKSAGVCCVVGCAHLLSSFTAPEKTKASSLLRALIAVIRMHRRSRCDGTSPRGDSACKVPPLACF